MHKKIVVGLACLFTFSALIAWSLGATNGQEPAPQAEKPAAQSAQPKAGADSGKADETAAPAKHRNFTDDSKPYLSDRHVTLGLKCESCHGEASPTKAATTAQCLQCHGSFEALAKKTADMEPNPHSNHIVDSSDTECSFCHHSHKANEVGCNQCHGGLSFKRNSAAQ
jgi:hypothetical protein